MYVEPSQTILHECSVNGRCECTKMLLYPLQRGDKLFIFLPFPHVLGTFGQGMWCVGDPSAIPKELPADLKKAGSCQTLKVLNEGKYPHWM